MFEVRIKDTNVIRRDEYTKWNYHNLPGYAFIWISYAFAKVSSHYAIVSLLDVQGVHS